MGGAGEGQEVTVGGATPGAEARILNRAEIRDLSRGAEAEQRDLLRAQRSAQSTEICSEHRDLLRVQIKTGSQVTTRSINPSALNFIVIPIPQLLMSFAIISPQRTMCFEKNPNLYLQRLKHPVQC